MIAWLFTYRDRIGLVALSLGGLFAWLTVVLR